MKFHVDRRILLGFLISMLVIVSLGISSYAYMQDVIRVSRMGVHAQHVLLLSEQVRSIASANESSTMKYIHSGNKVFLKNLSRDALLLRGRMEELDSLVLDNPIQLEAVRKLETSIELRIKFLDEHATQKQAAATAAVLSTIQSENAIAEYQKLINIIQAEATASRREQQAIATEQFYEFAFAFFALLALGLILPLILAYTLNIKLKERNLAEEKLKLTLAFVHDLYEKAPCGYFSIDKQGMFTNMNETLLGWLGYSRVQVVDRLHFTEILTPQAAALFDREFSQLQEAGSIHDIESRVARKDKSTIPVVINATAIVDQLGNYMSSRGTLFDITERKKAEEVTRRLNAELESFSYSVSHDLRSPLRSVNGFAKILKEDYASSIDDEGNRVIDKIINNANRMGQLIDDLLNFARIGKKEIMKSEINMSELVTQISNELIDQEKGREIKIEIEPLENCVADPSMIRQVWINLLSNAIKYSRKEMVTKIEIGSERNQEEVVFHVKDNGVGFDMKFATKLFGVFQRLHKMEEFEGTGVGLALVKRIIERHDGRIWAEAKLNEGASFYFAMQIM